MRIIYALIDPRDKLEFYVGRTDDLFRRFKEHLSCVGTNEEKNARIRELQSLYLVPIMETIELVENDALSGVREAHWIRHYLSQGRKLLNRQIDKAFTFDQFTEIMNGFSNEPKTKEPEAFDGPLIPIEDFMYHTVNGVRRRRTYLSYEDASRCTGYTVKELEALVKRHKIRENVFSHKLILTSLRVKPYFGANILDKKKRSK